MLITLPLGKPSWNRLLVPVHVLSEFIVTGSNCSSEIIWKRKNDCRTIAFLIPQEKN